MPNSEQIIDAGFAALKNATPRQGPAQLMEKSNRLAIRARVAKGAAGFVAAAAAIAIFALALQPQSALASLKESERLSASQPIIHVHSEQRVTYKIPTSQPYPQQPDWDVWRFADRYVRFEGHELTETFKKGTKLCYDDRFSTGYRANYDPSTDRFWKFDGTMNFELMLTPNKTPQVSNVVRNGSPYLDYHFQDSNRFGYQSSKDVLVDPKMKLIRFADQDSVGSNGDVRHEKGSVEYPDEATAKQQVPHFPKGLKFQTKQELLQNFNSTIGQPDQTKTIGGINVTLYGVIVYPNLPDGIGVIVLTRGGSGPGYGSGNPPQIVDQPLLAAKRLDWVQPPIGASHVRFGDNPKINGQMYIANKCEDLMVRAPSRLTIRVPVWRPHVLVRSKEGKMMPVFVGFVTFTTSKLYCNTGEGDWNFY